MLFVARIMRLQMYGLTTDEIKLYLSGLATEITSLSYR